MSQVQSSLNSELPNFIMKTFRLEKSKLILPVLMCAVLVTGALSITSLEDTGEDLTQVSLESVTNNTIIHIEREYFNDSINHSQTDIREQNSYDRRKEEIMSKPLVRKRALMSKIVINSGLLPLTPDMMSPPFQDKELMETQAVLLYRVNRLNDLGEEINSSSNYSYNQFQEEASDIRGITWGDREVNNFVSNYSEDSTSGILGSQNRIEDLRSGNISNVTLLSFIPSVFSTFLIYFCINALIIEVYREEGEKIYNIVQSKLK